jgi:hypothetical protein
MKLHPSLRGTVGLSRQQLYRKKAAAAIKSLTAQEFSNTNYFRVHTEQRMCVNQEPQSLQPDCPPSELLQNLGLSWDI